MTFLHGIKINVIRDHLDNIRRLRNRIFHYEPIWHWQDLQVHYDAIIQAIEWLDPVLLDLISHSKFNNIYSQKPANIKEMITVKMKTQEMEPIE